MGKPCTGNPVNPPRASCYLSLIMNLHTGENTQCGKNEVNLPTDVAKHVYLSVTTKTASRRKYYFFVKNDASNVLFNKSKDVARGS